jgi:hypothetical protein
MPGLNDRQFRKVIPGIGDNGEDLHTGMDWHGVQPGDKMVGLDGATVKSVVPTNQYGEPVTHGKWTAHHDVTLSHPDKGEWTEHRRGYRDNLALYRAPAKGKKA